MMPVKTDVLHTLYRLRHSAGLSFSCRMKLRAANNNHIKEKSDTSSTIRSSTNRNSKLVNYMNSGPVVPMVCEGLNVVKTSRQMLGATNPADSLPGTIRGDFCTQVGRNIMHGSNAVQSAEKEKEIALRFNKKELVTCTPAAVDSVYE